MSKQKNQEFTSHLFVTEYLTDVTAIDTNADIRNPRITSQDHKASTEQIATNYEANNE